MTSPAHAASQASVSESNRSRILEHLYHNGVCSRAQIAKALGLTPAAITKITARLIDAGVIEETGDIEGRLNRRSIGLRLDGGRFHVIGVKFARSLVQIGVFDLDGTLLSIEELPTVSDDTIPQTIAAIHLTIDDLLDGDPAIVAIGMAVPGPYLRDIGYAAIVSSMQGWRNVNFPKEFAHAFRVPVFVEQDARAGALAQRLFSTDGTCDTLAYYLLGEGIGLGVIDHGALINGHLGTATEIGHVSVDINGRPCDCGNVGCLERYCSAVAIHQAIDQAGLLGPGSPAMTHREACNALFRLVEDGDARAAAILDEAARYIGFGCVSICNLFNPQRIVIGDIVAGAGQRLLDRVVEITREHVSPDILRETTITLSTLPSDAAVSGAAAVAITQFLDHPSMFFDVSQP